MAAIFDLEGDAILDHRADIALRHREIGMAGSDVERGERRRRTLDGIGMAGDLRRQHGEMLQLKSQRAITGLRYAGFDLAKLDRREADGTRQGLAVDEASARSAIDPLALARRHLDIVAEHLIVADFKAGNAGFADIAGLEIGDQPPAFIPQQPPFVEIGGIAGRDKSAVPRQQRQFRCQRPLQQRDQAFMRAQLGLDMG